MAVRRRQKSDTEHDHNRCSRWPVMPGDDQIAKKLYLPHEIVETKKRSRKHDYCNECRSKHRRGVPENDAVE